MKLYHRDDCPFCWKARIGFAFAGVSPQLIQVDRGTRNPDVLKLSKAATVPVFVDGDIVITQSAILLEYIDDRYAKGKLFHGSSTDRLNIRSLCYYSDTYLGAALKGLVFERRDKPVEEQDLELINISESRWRECLGDLENKFIGPFMCGEFSAADCALLPRLALAETYSAGVDKRHKRLDSYWRDSKVHEAFKKSQNIG